MILPSPNPKPTSTSSRTNRRDNRNLRPSPNNPPLPSLPTFCLLLKININILPIKTKPTRAQDPLLYPRVPLFEETVELGEGEGRG